MKTTALILLSIVLFACGNSNQDVESSKDTSLVVSNDTIMNDEMQDSIISEEKFDKDYISDEEEYEEFIVRNLDSANIGVNFYPKGNYVLLKAKIRQQQERFQQKYLSADSIDKLAIIDSAANYITKTLLNDIFPFWYGTPWDFDGYTEKPNKGVIACGYFVSTTLRDVGLNINRFHMAQQAGLFEAKTLQLNKEIIEFSDDDDDIKKTILEKLKPGLYFVGLDGHVGYIWINNNELFFIHSNYVHNSVELEYAETSEAFISYNYVIADISLNDNLTKKWILNEKVEVVRP